MLHEFTTMENDSLGEMYTTEHCIELVSGARPTILHSYGARRTAREEKQFQVDKMLWAGVIEQV